MLKIILISGKKRSGKDYFANILGSEITKHGKEFAVHHFADGMKRILAKTFNISVDYLNELKNNPETEACFNENMRTILQRFGTDAMQSEFGEDVWVQHLNYYLEKKYRDYTDFDWSGNSEEKDIYIIIPDLRFEAETYLRPYSSIVHLVRVNNPNIKSTDNHPSEIALDNYKDFDTTVINDYDPETGDTNESLSNLQECAKTLIDTLEKYQIAFQQLRCISVHGIRESLQIQSRGLIYNNMSKLFLTSDWHLCHKNIIKYCNRPFEFSNKGLYDNAYQIFNYHQNLLNDDDILINLGDIGMVNDKNREFFISYFNALKGHKILILGNHDTEDLDFYKKCGFCIITNYIKIDKYFFCHYSLENNEKYPGKLDSELHKELRDEYKHSKCKVLYHGHTHEKIIPSEKNVKRINVCYDNPELKYCYLELNDDIIKSAVIAKIKEGTI